MPAGQGYHLYVIELDPAVPRRKAMCRQRDAVSSTPVYVGQSWYPPEVRFQLHKDDIRDSPTVKRFGLRLRPDLVGEPAWVRTKWLALRRERELAEELCRRGYVVFGGH
jgi:hypothetical protein